MRVIEDFPGSMIGGSMVRGDSVLVKLKKERPTTGFVKEHDYNLHFNFGLENDSGKARTVRILVECDDDSRLDRSLERIWTSRDPKRRYEMVPIEGKMDGRGRFSFDIEVGPDEKRYVANYYPVPLDDLYGEIEQAAKRGGFRKKRIGTSVMGNEISAYEHGDTRNRPCLVFASGYHPPELDPLFVVSMMEFLGSKKGKNGIFEEFSYSFIPLLNPDGFEIRSQGSNANDINFHWKFFGNTEKECPECHAVWNYLKELAPVFYMDLHAFTFQDNRPRPYLVPPHLNSGRLTADVQKDVNKRLAQVCDLPYSFSNDLIITEKIIAPNLLASGLRSELGTVTSPKFHLHMKDGEVITRRMASDVFENVVEAFHENGIGSKDRVLYRPYGDLSRKGFRSLLRSASLFFHLRVKKKLSRH